MAMATTAATARIRIIERGCTPAAGAIASYGSAMPLSPRVIDLKREEDEKMDELREVDVILPLSRYL
jgi:hypothetical protein